MLSVLPLFLKNFFLSGGKGNICRPRTFFPPSVPFNIIIKNRAALKNDGAHPPGRGALPHAAGAVAEKRNVCASSAVLPRLPPRKTAGALPHAATVAEKRNVCAYSAVLPRLPPQRTARLSAGSLCGGTALPGRQSGAPEIGRAALPAGSIPLSCNYNGGSRAFSREGDTKAAPANGRRPF